MQEELVCECLNDGNKNITLNVYHEMVMKEICMYEWYVLQMIMPDNQDIKTIKTQEDQYFVSDNFFELSPLRCTCNDRTRTEESIEKFSE